MEERLERYAELVVRVGANVQPGQEVFLYSDRRAPRRSRGRWRGRRIAPVRAVRERHGTRDGHVRRALVELGPDEALTYSPEWLNECTRQSVAGGRVHRYDVGRPGARSCWPTSTASASAGRRETGG